MSKKTIMTFSVLITLIFSVPTFAMMGGGGGSGHMNSQQHNQAMATTHDQYMGSQTGNHIPQAGQENMGQNGYQTDHGQGNLDHSTMDHDTMDSDQMTRDTEDFFRE